MGYKNNPRYNASGCKDLTAYEAIERVSRKEIDKSEIRYKKLLATIFKACDHFGFHLEGRITLKDKYTGKEYR